MINFGERFNIIPILTLPDNETFDAVSLLI